MHRVKVRVVADALDANNTIARANRADFDRAGVAVVNLMSAPGAGKTSLLERGLPELPGVRVGVLEGDVQGSMDADRLASLHVPVTQLNTDPGFGVALAGRLAQRELPQGVEVVDFGIRGMDLAYAMQDGYDAVVLLDATPRGEPPGTLYVIEADAEEGDQEFEAHGMDPVKVISLARTLGGNVPRTLIVGCEPQTRMTADDPDLVMELSEGVRLALGEAETLVLTLVAELTVSNATEGEAP